MFKIIDSIKKDNNSNIIKIIKGSIISICITLVLIIAFSVLLTYTNISEDVIPIAIIIISMISIIIGSCLCMIRIKRNGIVNGMIIGIIYISTLYFLSSIIEGEFALNIKSFIMIICSIISGIVGGLIGVNIRNKK